MKTKNRCRTLAWSASALALLASPGFAQMHPERIADLEEQVSALSEQLAELKAELDGAEDGSDDGLDGASVSILPPIEPNAGGRIFCQCSKPLRRLPQVAGQQRREECTRKLKILWQDLPIGGTRMRRNQFPSKLKSWCDFARTSFQVC